MNYRAAVKAFFDGGGQLQLGVGASLAVGPVGRAANISASASNANHIAATYAYSASKGLFIGYSFEGSKISERVNTNAAYYGTPISARDILTGIVPPSQDAARLYDILNSLGAGPRPGLPFASQKSKRAQSIQSSKSPVRTTPPPVNYANRPHTTAEGFEEPPPPYEANDGPRQTSDGPSQTNDAPREKQIDQSFNQAYMNKSSSYQSSSSYQASYQPVSSMADDKGKSTSFNRGDISAAAVEIQRTGGNISSSSSAPPISPVQPHTDIKKALPQQDAMTVVVAKYDYQSDSPSDLNFSAGDHIIVIKRLEDRQSWWEGEIGSKRGFFPANYTEDLED
jgi:hypothetical protein